MTEIILVNNFDKFPTELLNEAIQNFITHNCERLSCQNNKGWLQIWTSKPLVENANGHSLTFENKINKFGRVHVSFHPNNLQQILYKIKD